MMPEGEQEHKGKKEWLDHIGEVLKSNRKIATIAMRGATPRQKIVIYCCYGVILLGIIILSVPPYQATKELIALVLTVVPLVIVAVFVLVQHRNFVSTTTTTTTAIPQWQPLPNFKFEKIRTVLDETRKLALDFLKSKEPKLSDGDVRANIFYPACDSPDNPDKYVLKIYPGLHLNMDRQQELLITFEPKQGVTGNVFASGQARVAQRLLSDTGHWDSVYNITDELAAIIHPDLKWIISMPLKSGGNKPVGVMNVDGLRQQLLVDILYECMGKLSTNAVIMHEVMMSR